MDNQTTIQINQNIKLINADALQILKTIPDNSIDLICTDPPYNVSVNDQITRNGGKFGHAKPISLYFGDWDNLDWKTYIDDFARILTPTGVLVMFYDKIWLGTIGLYLEKNYNFKIRHIGCWVKTNPAPQARKVKWMNGTEMFLVATKNHGSGHHFNYREGESPDYFMHSVSYKHLHPTQKPEPLIEWIVKYWSFENDTVLDPFMGAGTTAVVTAKLNRKFIGIEIDKHFFEIAVNRVREFYSNVQGKTVKLDEFIQD